MRSHTRVAVALLISCFSVGVAGAENRTFIIPNNPDGYGVDRCLANGEPCGASVASAFFVDDDNTVVRLFARTNAREANH